ncbi:peptidase U32 family protein [Parasphaerochaeta coccoides]|nr:U32 family peptidase [Parasphaerochaeta coccoides]
MICPYLWIGSVQHEYGKTARRGNEAEGVIPGDSGVQGAVMELAMPAGSLQSALQAFSSGADAVYLGLKNFSARRGATNFSFGELMVLRHLADKQKKKIYVTVNTVITDAELCRVTSTLRAIAFIGCEGVIVQDLGVARLVRKDFPSLPLHASTQLAVHTIEGVKALQELGFSRVVLSRELTLDEIQVIRTACPDVEIKVFIHGAECYGFSGLCMASSQLCGRSANKGECAQICRTWFEAKKDPSVPASHSPLPPDKKKGWFFSMADLNGTGAVARLRDMGIDSLKVEGRMKNPAYVRATTRLYRAILDKDSSTDRVQEMEDDVLASFGRTNGGSWLAAYGRSGAKPVDRQSGSVLTQGIPGHQGLPVGTVEGIHEASGTLWLKIALSHGISLHDGLMYQIPTDGTPYIDIRFHVGALADSRGRRIVAASSGSTVHVALLRENSDALPCEGTMVSLVSAHDSTLALLNENLPRAKHPIPMTVKLADGFLTIHTENTRDYLPLWNINRTYPCDIQKARIPQDAGKNLRSILEASDTSFLTLGKLTIENHTSLADHEVFMPLSALKEIRRQWYEALDAELQKWLEEIPAVESASHPSRPMQNNFALLPPRVLLNDPVTGNPWIRPEAVWAALESGGDVSSLLPAVDGVSYLCLPPVMFTEAETMQYVNMIMRALDGCKVRVGLNNIGQIRWAARNPDVPVFCDAYFYLGNRQAAMNMAEKLPSLTGGYHWLESSTPPDAASWPFPPSLVGTGFVPPLFISRSCFRHDSLGLSCSGCPRSGSWHVTQTGKKYKVTVDTCITVVSQAG